MAIDIEIPDGLIVEGYYLQPPERVILKAHTDGDCVLLMPLNKLAYQIRVRPEAILRGGIVAKNLRVVGYLEEDLAS